MLAAWFHTLDPFVFQIGAFGPRWYGLSYVLSALVGFWLYRLLARRGYTDIAPERTADLITWVGLFGVLLGGRLGWIVFYGSKLDHSGDSWWWAKVWQGGMASHGGILGIVIVTFILSRRWKISWTSIGDSLCVVAPVGLFLVRCANFINGELYGHATQAAWAVQFPQELYDGRFADVARRAEVALEPHAELLQRYWPEGIAWSDAVVVASREEAVIRDALAPVLTPRHPSQLYEALLEGALLFAILWPLRTCLRMPRGAITGIFFILYASARIIGEIYRVPDAAFSVGSLSAGQYLSLYLYGIGAAFCIWAWCSRQYERADRATAGV